MPIRWVSDILLSYLIISKMTRKIALAGRISRKSAIESRLKFDANFQLGLANQSQLESLPNGYDNSWQGQR